jgi:hypothetical protein
VLWMQRQRKQPAQQVAMHQQQRQASCPLPLTAQGRQHNNPQASRGATGRPHKINNKCTPVGPSACQECSAPWRGCCMWREGGRHRREAVLCQTLATLFGVVSDALRANRSR